MMCLTCGRMDAAADENERSVAESLDIMERTKAKDRAESQA
jgi:hypothetical protein